MSTRRVTRLALTLAVTLSAACGGGDEKSKPYTPTGGAGGTSGAGGSGGNGGGTGATGGTGGKKKI